MVSQLVLSPNCDYDHDHTENPPPSSPLSTKWRIQRNTERKAKRNHGMGLSCVPTTYCQLPPRSSRRMLPQQLHLNPPSRLLTLWQPSLAQEVGTWLVEPEKENLLHLAGSQSRADVANDQLQGRKRPPLAGKNKHKKNNKWSYFAARKCTSCCRIQSSIIWWRSPRCHSWRFFILY